MAGRIQKSLRARKNLAWFRGNKCLYASIKAWRKNLRCGGYGRRYKHKQGRPFSAGFESEIMALDLVQKIERAAADHAVVIGLELLRRSGEISRDGLAAIDTHAESERATQEKCEIRPFTARGSRRAVPLSQTDRPRRK